MQRGIYSVAYFLPYGLPDLLRIVHRRRNHILSVYFKALYTSKNKVKVIDFLENS